MVDEPEPEVTVADEVLRDFVVSFAEEVSLGGKTGSHLNEEPRDLPVTHQDGTPHGAQLVIHLGGKVKVVYKSKMFQARICLHMHCFWSHSCSSRGRQVCTVYTSPKS